MNVAVVHYHLADGGVAAVIRRSLPLMMAAGVRQVVFTGGGGPSAEWHRRVDGLGYGTPEICADVLLERLMDAACGVFGSAPDLWHFHNHSLGKNPHWADLVARLAADGARLLLHIHDLAEDGRPGNACHLGARHRLYPTGPRVHYAFLNARDLGRFVGAGLPQEHAHLLPNPITAQRIATLGGEAPLMLAPVRGIRRKNLGELVLLAALAPPGTRVAVTRAPRDPEARGIHDGWLHFAAEAAIPVAFDVVDRIAPAAGAGCSFHDWLAHGTHIVTTSVAEGFGLPFHEASAWGRPLLGRALPHLPPDHAGNLYDHLLVPEEWIDADLFIRLLECPVRRLHAAWGRTPPPDACHHILAAMRHRGFFDFGNLPEIIQRQIIRRAMNPAAAARIMVRADGRLQPAGDWLAQAVSCRDTPHAAALPAACLPERHQADLTALYRKIHTAPAPGKPSCLDSERILDACLGPQHFHFLTASSAPRHARRFRAVVFDVYGTLLVAPAGGVRVDPGADPRLREVIRSHGHEPPHSPGAELHAAVRRHHQAAGIPHPEIDLRELWREVLSLPPGHDTTALVIDVEAVRHPARPMPGASEIILQLASEGIPMGLLSNAQCNTLDQLGGLAACFEPDLAVLSYRHGIAKPSPVLFELMLERLAARGISPAATLYVGNDPRQDIAPAAAAGMCTALFTGHPESLRPGACEPDHVIGDWCQLIRIAGNAG